ncbi:flagellar hook-basal body complex protein FliE [Bacillus sp. FJAT-47783]|uniref:flagellar hook-basal body complex protein FliE n=1 Tax=Bacillus sp. FJAT-47783 TaxID=2922712 RepID=UPI001FACEC87|nr:flagellar hook-basal body complex protein FliE [Bacillus sp. FJAT-47783]
MMNGVAQVQPAIHTSFTANQPIAKPKTSFSTILKQTLNTVNDAQLNADNMTNDFVSGKPVELHNVMIASEKANILLHTTIEVRNKAVEAYQEMMRMQV